MLAQLRTDQNPAIDTHHGLRRLVLLAVAFALVLVALLPGRAAAAEIPFTCDAFGYLSQNPGLVPPDTLYRVDLASGEYSTYVTENADSLNALGYNTLDNYMYAWDDTTSGLVRVSSDGSLTQLGLPAGVALPAAGYNYNVGDFDRAGHYWMMNAASAKWYEIDLAPGSPTYGEVIDSGTVTFPAGVGAFADWTWISGALYGVAANGTSATLEKFDPATGQVTVVGTVAGAAVTSGYGATYTDAAGDLFASNNASGEIYRINVATAQVTASSQGPAAGNNDGARCSLAPIPTITVTKTVSDRSQAGDQFTVGLSDSSGKALTSATTSGTGTTATTTNWPVSQGQTYTISDAMGAGSPDPLSDYVPSIACTDTTTGAKVTPGGSAPNWTLPVSTPDEYTCNITNGTSADLEAGKSASPATAVPGEDETYTLTVKNKGPSPANEVTITDPLPEGLSFVSADPGCIFAGGTVTCAAGRVAAGASKSFKVVTKVAGSVSHRIENTAKVHSPTSDPNPKNNEETVVTPVGPKADLQLIKTASTDKVDAGGQVMYTLVVNNNGPSDATGVTVDDTLPSGLTLVSAQPSQGSCSGTKCGLGTIADGGSAQILVTANVSSSAAGNIKNTASVIGDQPDPNPKNNEDGSTVEVVPTPPAPPQPESDIKIVKKVDHGAAFPGQVLTYTLTVSNLGPDTASNVNLTDTPSLSLKTMSAKSSQGSCKVDRPLTCALGTIKSGGHETVKVLAKVRSLGTENNVASATSAGKDPNPKNNIDAARTKLTPMVLLKKTVSARTVNAGSEVTYHLTATNPMIIAIHDVKVCDAFPAGLAYVSSDPKGKLSNGQTCWTLKTLAAGKSKAITLLARALPGASGNLTNHATATAKGMKPVAAHATVHVTPAPKVPTPVTG